MKGPFIKNDKTSFKLELDILISLIPVIIYMFVKTFTTSISSLVAYIGFTIVCITLNFMIEMILDTIIFKEKDSHDNIMNRYSLLPGLLLSLILPTTTSIIYIVIALISSNLISTLLLKKTNKKILNTVVLSKIIIMVLNGMTLDYSNVLNTYVNLVGNNNELLKIIISSNEFYPVSLLSIVGFIYLVKRKAIKWRIPLVYVITFLAIIYVIGGMNNLGLGYPIFEVLVDSIIFISIYLAANNETSPVTPIGQVMYGLFLGILTVIFKYLIPISGGIYISILLLNILTIYLDYVGSRARFNFKITFIPFIISWLLILCLSIGISMKYNTKNDASELRSIKEITYNNI